MKSNDVRVIRSRTTCSIHTAGIAAGQLCITTEIETNDAGQWRVREQRRHLVRNIQGLLIIASQDAIKRTLHELSVCTHGVNNMAEGSAGVTEVMCADKQKDIPDGEL